jgi:hypothetical protein
MSKTTLRKRISLTAATALFAGMLTVVSTPVASAQTSHTPAGSSTTMNPTNGVTNGSMMTSVVASSTTAAAVPTAANGTGATQKGLLSKDTSSGTAQTATILAGGSVSFYGTVTTAAAFTATGGSFSSAAIVGSTIAGLAYNSTNTQAVIPIPLTSAATTVATLWTAPTTVGTYSVSLLTGFYLNSAGLRLVPTNDDLPPTLSGKITVTVVATSAGGSFSAAFSTCQIGATGASTTAGTTGTGIDTLTIFEDGQAPYINYDLNDGYNANLPSGNLVVTSTEGALVNIGAGGELTAGTATTKVLAGTGEAGSIRIDQKTAGAPITTTVTLSYNGTTVCTKTVTIRGKVAKLTVANVGAQKTTVASTVGGEQWMYQQVGAYVTGALFTVVATDSAGNVVSTPLTYGTYSADSATLNTTVQAITVNARSSTASASSVSRYNYGGWTCGADAGAKDVKIKFTITATGDVITSDAFNARCAGDAVTYSASLDKAAYNQGELATVTVKFLDSKGNPTHTSWPVGANTWSLPYMTGVEVNLAATNPASSTAVTKKNNGESTYLLTVGTTSGLTAGSYTGVIEFSSPALGTKQTPTYKLSTGGDTTSNADVLKSIVALIASINKQIQALQKLILKR